MHGQETLSAEISTRRIQTSINDQALPFIAYALASEGIVGLSTARNCTPAAFLVLWNKTEFTRSGPFLGATGRGHAGIGGITRPSVCRTGATIRIVGNTAAGFRAPEAVFLTNQNRPAKITSLWLSRGAFVLCIVIVVIFHEATTLKQSSLSRTPFCTRSGRQERRERDSHSED